MWRRIHRCNTYYWFIGGITSLDVLYDEVHIIAFKYHWGESEIMNLPFRKRKRYVRLILEQQKADQESINGEDSGTFDYTDNYYSKY